MNYSAAIARPVSTYRIGIPREPFFDDLDPEIAQAVEKALSFLGKITKTTTEVKCPAIDTIAVLFAETYAYHARYVTDAERKKLYHPNNIATNHGRCGDRGAGVHRGAAANDDCAK